MRIIRRILIAFSVFFALGWFIPYGSGSHESKDRADSITYWQDGELSVDANGASKDGGGMAYWQLEKKFMFAFIHLPNSASGKVYRSVGFVGNHRSAELTYDPGVSVLIEGFWLEIVVGFAALPLLHSAWRLLRRKNSGRGFPLERTSLAPLGRDGPAGGVGSNYPGDDA